MNRVLDVFTVLGAKASSIDSETLQFQLADIVGDAALAGPTLPHELHRGPE